MNGFSRYKKGRHSFQGGGSIGDLVRAVIHFINRWARTKDRLGDLKQKQQELINKSKDLLPPQPSPTGNGNGRGPEAGTSTPPGDSAQRPIDLSTNGIQPPHPAQFLALKGDLLQEICAQRGIKVAKRARKDVIVGLLLADPNGPPPLSLLPPAKTKPSQEGRPLETGLVSQSSKPWSSVSIGWSSWCC